MEPSQLNPTAVERSCGHCGAAVKRLDAERCEYCDHDLSPLRSKVEATDEAPPSTGSGDPGGPGTRAARFEALRDHPDYAKARAQRPSSTPVVAQNGSQGAAGLIFAGICFAMGIAANVMMDGFAPFPFPVRAVAISLPFAMGVFATFAAMRQFSLAGKAQHAPAKVFDALVVKEMAPPKRGEVTPPFVFLTLETKDGQRRQLRATRELAGGITVDDIGVAFRRADYLLGFERLPC